METIPTLDLSRLSRGECIQDLQQACEEWGFFKLTGHSISAEAREELLGEMEAFFSMTTAVKEEILRSDENPWAEQTLFFIIK